MLEQHRAGKRHRLVVAERDLVFEKFAAEAPLWAAGAEPADVVTGWSPAELSAVFPMRATCLDKHATVGALPARARARFWRYLHDRFGARAPELAAVFHDVDARGGGRYLRVKELFEALEAADVIARHIAATEARRGGAPTTAIYDLACGHGLVGLLLAGRFRGARVVCVDLARRGAFDAFRDAFAARRQPGGGGDDGFAARVEMRACDVRDVAASELGPRACVVAVRAGARACALRRALRKAARTARACALRRALRKG